MQQLLWLLDRLNQGDSLSSLVPILGITLGRISQIISEITITRYILAPGADEYVQWYLRNHQWHLDQERKSLKKHQSSGLTLIRGALYAGTGKSDVEKNRGQVGAAPDTEVIQDDDRRPIL
jgi:hypothetical protein